MGSSEAFSFSFISKDFDFTAPDTENFSRNGFVCFQRLLSSEGLYYVQQAVEEILASKHELVDPEWIMNLHQLEPLKGQRNWMLEIASDKAIIRAVTSCLGGCKPILYCSQLSVRLPSSDENERTPWHQDGGDGKVCTLWIALDHVDSKNGGLQVISGMHLKGKIPFRNVQKASELSLATRMASHNVFEIALLNTATTQQQQIFKYRLRAGGAGIHHPCLPHCSANNSSKKPRRVLILRFMAEGEPINKDSKLRNWRTGEW
eukprot:CAMPEP_0204840656 /NCGR_PEP_ID=MMETSP1346-20131115/38337_1 /ASSEMBLY_ACC=CAM_ASM_000771 /TAXON_ID=215587 /ORGANISM="Aplanochytrium stocchinoi, Strain GSBS06" /LENGTH=260 /DNA_ID=CAMNT_0051978181 /DNA_START=124 /DNA_END=903 /DNA_ORIENTATION=+